MDALLEEIEKQPEDIFRQRLRWQWRFAGEARAVSSKWGGPWAAEACVLALSNHKLCPSQTATDLLFDFLAG